ncbi:mandelate racemase [Kibdelosporangium aridum]|uniref:Mandelate racemase n=1 Tax=Kibdelosporangium aridum TaxID=2030 RepID=A0A428ZB64_KIBAR|nr:enolase C-terminal domain-like protein [Kibdelosporangium aridum]RSM85271.1 mandelate racemase [Kibdelosporangium aridum]
MTWFDTPVDAVEAAAYRVPVPVGEADGTLQWDGTTIVVVHVCAGEMRGLGWTYADRACVSLIQGILGDAVRRTGTLQPQANWHAMQRAIRNLGRPGLVSCAMSALDTALWDLSARLAGLPLSRLLGQVRDEVDVYGSGGFTTLANSELQAQIEDWAHEKRIPRVKIKVGESWGSRTNRDLSRVEFTRKVAGDDVDVYVDANGAYSVGQASRMARRLTEWNVSWFEEPVSSDDLSGLARIRGVADADVAAGEYGYDLVYFEQMLAAEAVDCLQVDVTRCGGYTEWLRVAALAAARNIEVSAHCAPNLSTPVAVATPNFRHIEWFIDHDRIESEFFDGATTPLGGVVAPAAGLGHGMTLREVDARRYRVA